MAGDEQWLGTLREALAERAMRHPRPDPETLIDYVEGRLSPAEREAVEEAAALDPEVAGELAELASFPDLELPPGVEMPDGGAVGAAWKRFQGRLAEIRASWPPPPGEPCAVPAAAVPARRSARAWTWARAAALLFVLTTGALLVALFLDRDEPRVNVAVAQLVPVDDDAERSGGGEAVTLPAATDLMLVLALADARELPAYRLDLFGPAGNRRWSRDDLRRFPDGSFRIVLPHQRLDSGRYRLDLTGVGAGGDEPLARYELILAME